MLPVKLVTFDVTGTLLLFKTPVFQKYAEVGTKFGVYSDPEVLSKNFKKAWIKLNQEHPNFGKNNLGWQNWWASIVERTFNGYLSPNEKSKLSNITEDLIRFHTTKEAFVKRPGSDEFLSYLKQKSVKMGVISNYDPRLYRIIDVMELRNFMDFVLLSYDFGHTKPDVRIFKEALSLGNCITGSEAIHIGDNVELDYLGAQQAGFKSILMKSEKDKSVIAVNKNDICVDFYELKRYFQNIEIK